MKKYWDWEGKQGVLWGKAKIANSLVTERLEQAIHLGTIQHCVRPISLAMDETAVHC